MRIVYRETVNKKEDRRGDLHEAAISVALYISTKFSITVLLFVPLSGTCIKVPLAKSDTVGRERLVRVLREKSRDFGELMVSNDGRKLFSTIQYPISRREIYELIVTTFNPLTVYKKSSFDFSRMYLESMRLHCLHAIMRILMYSHVVDLYIYIYI